MSTVYSVNDHFIGPKKRKRYLRDPNCAIPRQTRWYHKKNCPKSALSDDSSSIDDDHDPSSDSDINDRMEDEEIEDPFLDFPEPEDPFSEEETENPFPIDFSTDSEVHQNESEISKSLTKNKV